jgi:hypothetical protein
MHYVLMGFDQEGGVRQYAFEGLVDGARTNFTVGVDMALIPGYGIRIQDLPLLCREVLEHAAEGNGSALTLTAKDMRTYADNCAIAKDLAQKRKTRRHLADRNPMSLAGSPAIARHHSEEIL